MDFYYSHMKSRLGSQSQKKVTKHDVVETLIKIRDAAEERSSVQSTEGASSTNPDQDGSDNESEDTQEELLPIDSHRNEIVQHVRTHRITVIHGETGANSVDLIVITALTNDLV